MRKRYRKRRSLKFLLAALILPILMCLAIVVALVVGFLQMSGAQDGVSSAQAATVSTYESISLMIAMLGIAVSVWVGLNIYNVLSREELNELLEQAERASTIVEDVYTEVLISKFRLLPADRTENYLAGRLADMERLPSDILKLMIALEDKFNYAYAMYAAGASTKYSGDEIEELEEVKEKCERNGALSKSQEKFLAGYIALRKADFTFYWVQYGKEVKESDKIRKGKNILGWYNEALKNFFRVKDLSTLHWTEDCPTEEAQGIALMANNICAAYLVILKTSDPDELEEAVTAGKVATSFSGAVQPRIRAVFERNLGAALERLGKKEPGKYMDEALYHYYKSYNFDQKNWKICYCIGSWYRKIFSKKYGPEGKFPDGDGTNLELEDDERDDAIDLLTRAAYWHWLEQGNNGGKAVEWLSKLKDCLKKLGVSEQELTDKFLCNDAGAYQQDLKRINAD